jgi:hypothetical protein
MLIAHAHKFIVHARIVKPIRWIPECFGYLIENQYKLEHLKYVSV